VLHGVTLLLLPPLLPPPPNTTEEKQVLTASSSEAKSDQIKTPQLLHYRRVPKTTNKTKHPKHLPKSAD
jgi:hypothetical protein